MGIKYKHRKLKGGYVPMGRDMMKSDAYHDLHLGGKALIPHLGNAYHTANQEAVTFSARQVADLLNIGKSTGARVLQDLVDKGFTTVVAESNWINGQARAYKLNWLPYHGREATDEWRDYVTSKLKPTSHQRDGPPQKRPISGTVTQKGKNRSTKKQSLSDEFDLPTVPPQVH